MAMMSGVPSHLRRLLEEDPAWRRQQRRALGIHDVRRATGEQRAALRDAGLLGQGNATDVTSRFSVGEGRSALLQALNGVGGAALPGAMAPVAGEGMGEKPPVALPGRPVAASMVGAQQALQPYPRRRKRPMLHPF